MSIFISSRGTGTINNGVVTLHKIYSYDLVDVSGSTMASILAKRKREERKKKLEKIYGKSEK